MEKTQKHRKALTKTVKEATAQWILGEGEAKTEQAAEDPTTGDIASHWLRNLVFIQEARRNH